MYVWVCVCVFVCLFVYNEAVCLTDWGLGSSSDTRCTVGATLSWQLGWAAKAFSGCCIDISKGFWWKGLGL